MKINKLYYSLVLISSVLVLSLSSCVKNEIDYKIPEESEYFDFSTQRTVSLSLNYGFTGYRVNFSVYTESPYDETGVMKDNVKPILGNFTDANSSFNGKIVVPSSVRKLYICSNDVAIPKCVTVDINNNVASYDDSGNADAVSPLLAPLTKANVGHESVCVKMGNVSPMAISSSAKLYALYSSIKNSSFVPSNSSVSGLYTTLSKNLKISENSTLAELLSRISRSLTKQDNSSLIADEQTTNIRIAKKTAAGEDVTDAHIDLVFLDAKGDYTNAMSYYYYKSDATLTGEQIKALPKYFVYPRTIGGGVNKPSGVLSCRLQFFGENYDQQGTDDFPSGYTIGWALVADICGYEHPYNGSMNNVGASRNLSTSDINNRIAAAFNNNRCIYSNKSANNYQNDGCIALNDSKSEKVILGFEDLSFNRTSDKSYEDMLFYVNVDPATAIYDPNRPELPEEDDDDLYTYTNYSTLMYEDIWPNGGDYDINDVIVEYTSTVYYNIYGYIEKIVDQFKPTNCGATYTDAFGVVYNNYLGEIDTEDSFFAKKEESNQFILFEDAKSAVGKTFKIVRDLEDLNLSVTEYAFAATQSHLINPFIVSKYIAGEKNRTEIHLPKYKPTSWCNQSLSFTEDDAYYINKDGKYPFALELYSYKGFVPVTEAITIGQPGEYPLYKNWVESNGTTNTDWYLYKK